LVVVSMQSGWARSPGRRRLGRRCLEGVRAVAPVRWAPACCCRRPPPCQVDVAHSSTARRTATANCRQCRSLANIRQQPATRPRLSQLNFSITYTVCSIRKAGIPRHPVFLVASSRDILARMSRGCYEETAVVEFGLNKSNLETGRVVTA